MTQPFGISLTYSPPVAPGSTAAAIALDYDAWSHNTAADAGYNYANITLSGPVDALEEWLESGLLRHITAYNPGGGIVWEGFVNKVVLAYGTIRSEIGPVLQIANKTKLVYSTVDYSVTPPAVGVRESTAWYSDTASQARYGVFEKVLSSGGIQATLAPQIAQGFLAENALPQSSVPSISLGTGGGNAIASIDCLGYYHLLKTYHYNTTTTGTQTISAKLQAVLAATPTAWFSTDYSGIATNASTTGTYDNDDNTAAAVVSSLISESDAAYNRYIHGFDAGRKFYYRTAPTTLAYIHRITADGMRIGNYPADTQVDNWDILPGRWIFIPDFLVGRLPSSSSDLRDDPRNVFIESVTYTTPNSLSIVGAKLSNLRQMLGRLGLSGIGG